MPVQKEYGLLDCQSGADKLMRMSWRFFLPFQDSPMFCFSSCGFAFIICDSRLFHGKFWREYYQQGSPLALLFVTVMHPWPGLMDLKSWGAPCVTYMSTCSSPWRNNVTFSSLIDIYQKPNVSLDNKAHWKPSHTNPYLTSNSHHHHHFSNKHHASFIGSQGQGCWWLW